MKIGWVGNDKGESELNSDRRRHPSRREMKEAVQEPDWITFGMNEWISLSFSPTFPHIPFSFHSPTHHRTFCRYFALACSFALLAPFRFVAAFLTLGLVHSIGWELELGWGEKAGPLLIKTRGSCWWRWWYFGEKEGKVDKVDGCWGEEKCPHFHHLPYFPNYLPTLYYFQICSVMQYKIMY